MEIEKVVIRTKSMESRKKIFDLITKGIKKKCSYVPGGHSVDKRYKNRNDMSYIGVFCEKVTIYY